MAKKLNEIHRAATFAWSPGQQLPLIAAGTVSGALDDSFSNASELELFRLDLSKTNEGLAPVGKVSTNARFNTLGWGHVTADKPNGIIAGGMENGELELWNPSAILDNKGEEEALIVRNSVHTGPLRSIDFNSFQSNLLASAGANSEVYIWDLTNPNKPYTPGARSSKLDDISSVAWNCQVQHILATSSGTGYTVVWDLRARKEIMTLVNQNVGGMGSGRRGISSVAWHPDIATQIVTGSEDDNNPVITLWDLRHAHSPEKTLAGHQKGVMGLSWCRQDSDLLMSCAKDCRTLCWNPRSGELLGELSQSTNWSFEVDWCPRNPDLLASASFDGKINVYSIQGAGDEPNETQTQPVHADDPFSAAILAAAPPTQRFALKQPPKWLRRPVGASFSFSGKLVSFNNKAGQAAAQVAAGMPPGSVPAPQTIPRNVKIATVATDPILVQRAEQLEQAADPQSLAQLIEERRTQTPTDSDDQQSWEILRTLFAEDAREQLMRYLGYKKEDVLAAARAITGVPAEEEEKKEVEEEPKADVVEPPVEGGEAKEEDTTETSATPEAAAAALSALNLQEPLDLFPSTGSDTDTLITRAIIVGDFDTAVQLCLTSDRLSDALLLAFCGGNELFAKTQKTYFERQAKQTAYLRLLQNIVDQDLASLVRNTNLDEWASVVVALCTFARSEDFGTLCESLGSRLEDAATAAFNSVEIEKGKDYRRHATLCYLAAGNLEKVANIWISEQEDEKKQQDEAEYGVRLQNLVEKVTIFRKAIEYDDPVLLEQEEKESYTLAALYDKYCEYAELMATQGQLDVALKYLSLTPAHYRQSGRPSIIRDRVYRSCASASSVAQYQAPAFPFAEQPIGGQPATQPMDALAGGAPAYGLPAAGVPAQQPMQQQQQQMPMQHANAYEPKPVMAPLQQQPQQPPMPAQQPQQQQQQSWQPYVPQPTAAVDSIQQATPNLYDPRQQAQQQQPSAPPQQQQWQPQQQQAQQQQAPYSPNHGTSTSGAWNDPAAIFANQPAPARSPAVAAAQAAPRRVTSPFPNMPAPTTFAPQPFQQQQPQQPYMQPPPGGPTASPLPPPPKNAVAPTPLMRQQQQYKPSTPPPQQQRATPPPAGPLMNMGPPMGGPPMGGPHMGGPPMGGPAMGGPPMGGPPKANQGPPPMNMNGPPMASPATGPPPMAGPPMGGAYAPPNNMAGPPRAGQPPMGGPPMGQPMQMNTSAPPMGGPPPMGGR
ncbi:hypothetical protein BCR43DRAFT_451486 [Syncephalastrum racemosum]|uniref:Protein transport protein SEC31 n=1 Tax=Syncephalastrum racemosum TaxID=13706 RepID=A0A1X2HW78_SYNRA|nr:hypothetical protein BCR43DRAFT_451486 [Syncephalastrum racemosum]